VEFKPLNKIRPSSILVIATGKFAPVKPVTDRAVKLTVIAIEIGSGLASRFILSATVPSHVSASAAVAVSAAFASLDAAQTNMLKVKIVAATAKLAFLRIAFPQIDFGHHQEGESILIRICACYLGSGGSRCDLHHISGDSNRPVI